VTPSSRAWWLPGLVAAACLLAMAPGGFEALRYERALVGAEPWRLLTAHLAHLGWIHLALNIAALAAIWAMLGDLLRPGAWAMAFLVCALGVTAGLWFGDPGLEWYVGLSGVLHGLFTAGASAGLRRSRLFHGLLLAGVFAKVTWEQVMGADAGSAALVGGAVIVNAHLYGVLAGLGCLPIAWRGRPQPPPAMPPRG
jgi:rhomboid family GlyGly-CTERM serine protease